MPRAKRGRATRILRGLLLALAAWALLTVLVVLALRFVPPPTTAFMLQARVAALIDKPKNSQFGYDWRPWNAISGQAASCGSVGEPNREVNHSAVRG